MLTDAIIQAATAGAMLPDGNRLRLRVTAPGAGAWQLKLRQAGKDTTKTLGAYPAVSINKARSLAEDTRAAAPAVPADPAPAKPATSAITFGAVGETYMTFDGKSAATVVKRRYLFEKLSKLHALPLTGITPSQVRVELERIQEDTGRDTAHRAAMVACKIFDHAQRHDIFYNPAARRHDWLKPTQTAHHVAVVEPKPFGVLAALVDMWGAGTVANATKFLMRTAVRPGELRAAQWSEFHDLDNPALARWEIPAERMKMKRAHVVPLSRQAVDVLKAQQANAAPRAGGFVFPNARVPGECISQGAIQKYLTACGYDETQHKPHGFRSSFTTLATEAGQEGAIIELCLAHADSNKVRAAYNRAARMDARRALMQWYSDYIETLKG